MMGVSLLWGIVGWLTFTDNHWLAQILNPGPTGLEARLAAAHIEETDFPAADQWHAYDPYDEETPNALITRGYEYSHQDAFWIKVSQQLRIYPNARAAQAAYHYEVLEGFTPKWTSPAGLTFSDHADMITVRCIESYINNVHHYPCRAIAVYDDMLVIFLANVFDDRWFTMADFEQLLTVMDARMVAAMETTKP